METMRDNSGYDADVHEPVLTTPDGHALPRVLDPVVTMDLVQRYVETERHRSRRVFLWMSTVFLIVILTILALFISVGVYVLGKSREAAKIADSTKEQTELYGARIADVSGKVNGIEQVQKDVARAVEKRDVELAKENKMFKKDLERFGQWVAATHEKDKERLMSTMETRVKEMEGTVAAREKDLARLRDELAAAKNAGVVAMAAKTGVARSPSTGEAGEERTAKIQADTTARAGEQGVVGVEDGRKTRALESAGVAAGSAKLSEELVSAPPEDPKSEEEWLKGFGGGRGQISVVSFPNGDRYEGEFKNGLFNGWGAYSYANGDKYEGEFQNDMKNGRGVFSYSNGDRYFGEFRSNMKEGAGRLIFRNGDRYVGDFKNDMMNGKGTFLYQSGNKYIGDFKNGLKLGNGVFYFVNGDVYKGEFKDDQRNGRGTYVFSSGAKYIGEFKDGKRNGHGRYIYEDGSEYVGDFKDGVKDGRGTCAYPDGRQLKGIWKGDKLAQPLD